MSETANPDADLELIEEAIKRMRAEPDARWHAVADLLAGGPLAGARLFAVRVKLRSSAEPTSVRYPDAARGVVVARTYLAEH